MLYAVLHLSSKRLNLNPKGPMRNLFAGLLLGFLSTSTAFAAISESVIEVQKNEKVYVVYQISKPEKTTLVLLPGVFRGIEQTDKVIALLVKSDINFVAIHFSGHPRSVLQYKASEVALYKGGKGLTSEMLAGEVEAVVNVLKIKKPLPVSLSYSATVVPHLNAKKFPVVIETAPIGAFGDNDPEGTAQRKQWADFMKLWPPNAIWVNAAKDKAYRDHWTKIANERTEPGSEMAKPENLNRLIEGYMAMARATEEFNLVEQDFKNTPRRIWILAENEEPYRMKLQLQALTAANKALGLNIEPVVIANSGHTIPMEQPEAYAEILKAIVKAANDK